MTNKSPSFLAGLLPALWNAIIGIFKTDTPPTTTVSTPENAPIKPDETTVLQDLGLKKDKSKS